MKFIESFKILEFIHYFDFNKNTLDVEKGKLKRFMKDLEDN
jgi:hypothetical protein